MDGGDANADVPESSRRPSRRATRSRYKYRVFGPRLTLHL